MDEGKFAADFVAKNIDNIFKIAKTAYHTFDESLKVRLKKAYADYLKSVSEKYACSKSFFIREQAVNLYSYYVPTGIRCGRDALKCPSYEAVTKQNPRVVVTGTGGSGKTVLLKHLFLDCIRSGAHVPVLVELRDLNSENLRLMEAIEESLDSHGYNVSGQYVARALKAGHFCFFLDGFDEVNHSNRKTLINDIRKLAKRYSSCPIIVSSRPDDVFQGIEDFDVYNILPLDLMSALSLIEKLPFDEAVKKKFIRDLREGLFERHRSFLSNPLLLSIMLLTYGENAEIPTKLSLFYNQAYEALFQRHDAYKAGFRRSRRTDLDIQDFSRVFSLFSLQTYEKRLFKMPRTECLKYIEKSRDSLGKKFQADDYLYDLLSAACLMLEDGLEISYSHRSFQEYFVALHISNASPEIQKRLINRYWKNIAADEVMQLLTEINPELVERELLIPRLKELFEELGVKRNVGVTHAARYIKKVYKSINIEDDRISATLNDNVNCIARLVHLSVYLCDTYTIPSNDHFKEHNQKMFFAYGKKGERVKYDTQKMTHRTPVLSDTIDGGGVFSKGYLAAAFGAYKELRRRHDKQLQSLDDLLGI